MTREEIKKAAEVMLAYVDGKKIECGCSSGLWVEVDPPAFNWAENNYRIKPEPKYRPFRTQEECWNEMHKHPDFGWIVAKNKKELVQIGRILVSRLDNVMITLSIDEGHNFNSSYYFNHYRFTDGEPFGIKEQN